MPDSEIEEARPDADAGGAGVDHLDLEAPSVAVEPDRAGGGQPPLATPVRDLAYEAGNLRVKAVRLPGEPRGRRGEPGC